MHFRRGSIPKGINAQPLEFFLKIGFRRERCYPQHYPPGSMTTMGVGGNTGWYAEPANTEDLRSLVEACKLFELPRAMMGRGSNLIVMMDSAD